MDKSRNYQSNVDISKNITNNETYESNKLIIDNNFNNDLNSNIDSDINCINDNEAENKSNVNGSINDIINEVKKNKGKTNELVSKINVNNNENSKNISINIKTSDVNKENNQNKRNKFYSKVLPIGKSIPLFALTGGLYFYYWFYKNVKNIQDYHNIEMSPKLSTICLFIPVFNLIILYDMFKKMENYIKKEGIESYSSVLMIVAVILLPFSFFIFPLTIFLTFWPYLNIQESFNEYWLKKEPNLPVKRSFSDGELLTLLVGGFIFSIFGLLFAFIVSVLSYPIYSIQIYIPAF